MSTTHRFETLLGGAPVIPVLVIDRPSAAVPIARALVDGGLPVLEVMLRTPAALEAVAAIAAALPDAIVGVGSAIDAPQFAAAADAGARFAVSPGATPELEAAAHEAGLSWLPGVQTVSEVLALRARGHRLLKFYPAECSGGVSFLESIAGPVPDVKFCPTGGVSPDNARDYLALGNVACVGGAWLTPAAAVNGARWDEIRALARQARSCARSSRRPLSARAARRGSAGGRHERRDEEVAVVVPRVHPQLEVLSAPGARVGERVGQQLLGEKPVGRALVDEDLPGKCASRHQRAGVAVLAEIAPERLSPHGQRDGARSARTPRPSGSALDSAARRPAHRGRPSSGRRCAGVVPTGNCARPAPAARG
jgi:2-dehydro-3-deoxyphosphogluconate aldolase / (4S)-4-hydroxy-2-oxoglutarate aldolase